MEMVVALAILAIVMSFAGVIFRVSVGAHRLALANAEILQKLRALTEQLDADFRGLRKDGEIMAFWRAERDPNYVGSNRNAEEAFCRFDRIMFFADGDFQSYGIHPDPLDAKAASHVIRGSMAWICYGLANNPQVDPSDPNRRPEYQKPQKRTLARTAHILMPPLTTANPGDPLGMAQFTDSQWRDWMNLAEVDPISMHGWDLIDPARKADIMSVMGDIEVSDANFASQKCKTAGGVTLDSAQPQSLHALLCQGVGRFEVQGWSDTEQRWIPSVNPNGDANLKDDSDFVLWGDDPSTPIVPGQWNPHQGSDLDPPTTAASTRAPALRKIPFLWYPRGSATIGNTVIAPLDPDFNKIAGLGRALKFTFTLYDSRGLIKNGKTFTHIVYLDN
jgi:hypothetical protein